ncbi:MAG: hypothetical protein C4297_10885 [Gemmataceae bacterium]
MVMEADVQGDRPGKCERAGSISTSLLVRLQAADRSDPVAWQRFYYLYSPLIHAWCRQRGLTQCDAEDVTQEVCQAVVRHIQHFRKDQGHGSFRGWLWRITENKIHDWHRAGEQARRRGNDFSGAIG